MRDNLDFVRIVCKPRKDACEEYWKINLWQTGVQLPVMFISIDKSKGKKKTDQGVHRLVRRLTRFETVVNFVSPRAHLNSADEVWVDHCLLIQAWEERWKVLSDEMGFGASG